MNILIVEDEPLVLQHLTYQLQQSSYNVLSAKDAQSAQHFLRDYRVDLAIVDLGLPDLCGLELIKQIREQVNPLPILILTARDNWRDKVVGLNAGADDYLVKPFELEELKARIVALLRRASGFADNTIRCGNLHLDCLKKQLYINSQEIELTHYEYILLEYFMRNHQQVLARTTLEDCLYKHGQGASSNVLEVLINRLRKKLEQHGNIKPIVTVRRVGYKFDLPCQ